MRSLQVVTQSSKWKWAGLLSIGTAVLAVPALQAQQTAIEKPGITRVSSDHGPVQPQQSATVTVHLKMHNEAAFDQAVDALYTPGSPTYHHWMTESQLAAYAPTAGELNTVKKEMESHGLTVLPGGSDNLSIRASGTMSSMESAFQTQIHEFEQGGKTFHANVTPARLAGPSGDLVQGVTGLSGLKMKSYISHAINPRTGKPAPMVPISKAAGGFDGVLTNQCFGAPFTANLTTAGASLPVGTYYGNAYTQGESECGWTPKQIQTHYGLDKAYAAGLDGTGQSIVLVEGPTEETAMRNDFNLFNQLAGIAGASTSNLQVLYPDGKPSPLLGYYWQGETDLDLQWAHAIAPRAKIVVLIMPSEDWQEFEYAIQYTMDNKLGNVISNSYGLSEFESGPVTIKGFDQVIKTAAAKGIAVNFSSGDSGDGFTGAPNVGGASFPADSGYATAIGGTSLDVPSGTGGKAETGWGNNQTLLSFAKDSVVDPPINSGFVGGAGGGESTVIAKPSWQKSIPGTFRQVPDISAVADPYTGAAFIEDGAIGSIGGTSLSCPIFSAIWALADQKAGVALGQAGPLLATLQSSGKSITDVVPVTTPTNVAGIVFDSAGATYYSADALMAPLYTTTQFTSAFWEVPTALGGGPGFYVDLSFGTDSSLQTAAGWDNVTGWGIPNGLTFINAAAALK